MPDLSVNLVPATAEDAESLAELRVLAMQPSLERLGRFDPQRARHRFLSTFEPRLTRHVEAGGERVGFVVVRPHEEGWLLDHFYIHPDHQDRGIGATVLLYVFREADQAGQPIRVGALRESDSNRFYVRYGFRLVQEAEWDLYYVRDPEPPGSFA